MTDNSSNQVPKLPPANPPTPIKRSANPSSIKVKLPSANTPKPLMGDTQNS